MRIEKMVAIADNLQGKSTDEIDRALRAVEGLEPADRMAIKHEISASATRKRTLQLQAAARGLHGAALDQALEGMTIEQRIAVKHMAASGELSTDEVISIGMLRSDRQAPGQGGPAQVGQGPANYALDRGLVQAGFDLTGPTRYGVKLADMLLKATTHDSEMKMALKNRLAELSKLAEDGASLDTLMQKVRVLVQAQRKTSLSAAADKPGKSCEAVTICQGGARHPRSRRVWETCRSARPIGREADEDFPLHRHLGAASRALVAPVWTALAGRGLARSARGTGSREDVAAKEAYGGTRTAGRGSRGRLPV